MGKEQEHEVEFGGWLGAFALIVIAFTFIFTFTVHLFFAFILHLLLPCCNSLYIITYQI